MDLVEVAPNARPPVCKILDYGKLRYEQSRKGGKNKVHQQKLKEIRVRPKTGDHDVELDACRQHTDLYLSRTPATPIRRRPRRASRRPRASAASASWRRRR